MATHAEPKKSTSRAEVDALLQFEVIKMLRPTFESLRKPLVAQKWPEEYINAHPPLVNLPDFYLESPRDYLIPPYNSRHKPVFRFGVPFKTKELIANALANNVVKPEQIAGKNDTVAIRIILFNAQTRGLPGSDVNLRYALPLSMKYDGLIFLCHNYEMRSPEITRLSKKVVEQALSVVKKDLGIESHWDWLWWWDGKDAKEWESPFRLADEDEIYSGAF